MNMKIDSFTLSNPTNQTNSINPINATNPATITSAAAARKQADIQAVVDQNKEGKKNVPVKEAVKVANDIMKMFDAKARFEYSIDDATKIELVKVVDKDNGQLIRQYPPQEIVSMLTKMYDMLGIIVDKKF
jgi:flagellar protein FlaG